MTTQESPRQIYRCL